MKKEKLFTFLVLILVTLPIVTPANAYRKSSDNTRNISYKIDFKPPSVILDCFSFFYLNVSVKENRLPFMASVFVFLYISDEKYGNKISLIGYEPLAYFPATKDKDKINISIPCITTNRFFYRLTSFKSGVKEKFNLKEGYIGVKLVKIRKVGIKSLIFGILWKKYFNLFIKNFSNLFTSNVLPIKMVKNIILSKLLFDFRMWKEIHDPFVVWKKVAISSPFVYSDKIKFNVVEHSEETDEKGRFYVKVKIENQLECDVICGILVDISSEPFINAFFPTAKVTRYNTGFKNISVPAGKSITKRINCSFPQGGFLRKNYTVRVECGPYVPVGNSNQLGIYMYSIRWQGFIKPYYKVNATVQEAIKKFWYNLPILIGNRTTEFLPAEEFNIKYRGEEIFTVEKAIKKASSELKKLIVLVFISVLVLILITLFVYKKLLEK